MIGVFLFRGWGRNYFSLDLLYGREFLPETMQGTINLRRGSTDTFAKKVFFCRNLGPQINFSFALSREKKMRNGEKEGKTKQVFELFWRFLPTNERGNFCEVASITCADFSRLSRVPNTWPKIVMNKLLFWFRRVSSSHTWNMKKQREIFFNSNEEKAIVFLTVNVNDST